MATICRHFIISGQVQGVFYRASTEEKARKLRLTGWVRNMDDGRVELVACGEEYRLDELEAWLWDGPIHADVDLVESRVYEEQARFRNFVVRF